MPQFGETVQEEITVLRWLKKVGQTVAEGEALLEIETDKAAMTVEAADSGRLARITQEAGAVVRPGAVIGYLEE